MLLPLYGQMSPLGVACRTASQWWLSGGISAANCIAAYQPKGAASLAESYTNLANPGTYNAAPGIAPSLISDGWSFTGTEYLTTGIPLSTGYSAVVRFSNWTTTNDKYLFGAYNIASITLFALSPRDSAGLTVYWNGRGANGFRRTSPSLVSGILAVAGNQGYRNGLADGNIFINGFAPTVSPYLGGLNADGTLSNGGIGYIQAIAIYNVVLSAAQVLAVTNAMNAL